jgi:integration host factor beta subunit
MTKSDLVTAVADRMSHVSKKDTETIVNSVFESMAEALKRGERIEIRGFGSFQVKTRDSRDGRNPKSGQLVSIPTSGPVLQGGQGAEGARDYEAEETR